MSSRSTAFGSDDPERFDGGSRSYGSPRFSSLLLVAESRVLLSSDLVSKSAKRFLLARSAGNSSARLGPGGRLL